MALGDFDVWNMFDNLGRYRVSGGTKRLLNRMHADSSAETRFNSPVAAIIQSGDAVKIVTKSGEEFRARRAIVAVPLNCLNDIEFQPGLVEAKRRVSRAHHTGSGTKVYVRIRGRSPLTMCTGTHDMPLNFLWTEYDDEDSQILVGFGASPKLLDINSDAAVAAAVRNYLPDSEMLEFFTYDWNVDPYARGTWCMYRPNVLTQDFADLKRAEGSVHFAGGDIADGWRGFIDGAIESGLRVGQRIADQLNNG
jgi:monoamine oxidase